MNLIEKVYRIPLGLLNDLYQLSMAYSYWKSGTSELEATYHLYFRKTPFQGGYAISCGLEQAIELIEHFRFSDEDLDYLGGLVGTDQKPLFSSEFLAYLRNLELKVHVDAIEEGRVVFGQEPLLKVQGPVLQCQLLETALLNVINFQTLIATKASRIKSAAGDDPVIEFGARRAQGIDGALTASRAAYIGGCDATSNLLAGRVFGIPVRGTHAHSWVMLFDDEPEAFRQFAYAMPNNSIFLVDTYSTLEGVKNAIEAGKWLKDHGHRFSGIRLDSGDLNFLSIEARKLLDAAGFHDTFIVGSNDLNEHLIEDLKRQGSKITVWGVGTQLVTAFDQPTLGGVYKLAAVRGKDGKWKRKIKLSEQTVKTTIPGPQQVRRFKDQSQMICDMIYDTENPPSQGIQVIIDPTDPTHRRKIPSSTPYEDLLIPVIRNGKRVYSSPTINEIRERALKERNEIHAAIRRFVNPHIYPVGLEKSLYERRARMILETKGFKDSPIV